MTIIFDILKQLILFLKFHSIRIGKWFSILFKRNRKLKKLSFDYYKNWHSDNSFLVVDIKFANGIYFKVGDFKSFDFTKLLILNFQNLNTGNIKVEVFGFMQKQVFIIELNKEIQLNTKSFKTVIENISPVEITKQKTRTKTKTPNFWFVEDKPKVTNQNIAVNSSQITINHKKFNTQDYI